VADPDKTMRNRSRLRSLFFAGLVLGMLAPFDSLAVATPPRDYPDRPVREFLKVHFASSRAFTPRGLDQKERLLTRRFRRGIYSYFERIAKADSAPPLVLDPFTGSQGATTYTIGDARVRVEKAWVPVRFSDGVNEWTLTYLLRNDLERNDERWYIDDIQDRRGMLLSQVLRK